MPQRDEGPRLGAQLAARGRGLTRRAVIVLVVALVLMLSYASSLHVYFRQQGQLAQAQQVIDQRQDSITSLQQQVSRWHDSNYVMAQARTRLGWVLPGEIGYQVIGADGKVLSPSVDIDAAGITSHARATTWWQKLDQSVRTADQPSAASATSSAARRSTAPRTITPTTTPTAVASATASATSSGH